MFLGALQPWHLILVLVIVLVLFGPRKLPQLGKSLGLGIKEFKQATTEFGKEPEPATTTPASSTPAVAQAASPGRGCPSCGKPTPPEMKFCGGCGATLVAPVAAVR